MNACASNDATTPARRGPPALRAALGRGLAIAAAIALVAWPHLPMDPDAYADASQYVAIAQGHFDQVARPWANRVFEPWLAGALARGLGAPLGAVFLALGVGSLAVFCVALAWLLGRQAPWRFALLALVIPFLYDSLLLYYLPDFMHAALGATLLVALDRNRVGAGALVVCLMQLTRESTLLFAGVALLIALARGKRRWVGAIAGAALAGMAVTAWATRDARPNLHGMPELVYLALKAPFNFAKHYLGVILWSDSLANLRTLQPVWTWRLPAWAPTGKLREVGIVGFDIWALLGTLTQLVTLLGACPLVAILAFVRRGRRVVLDYSLVVSVAATYGLAAFFIGPLLGDWVSRLMGYGWPLLLAGPAILAAEGVGQRQRAAFVAAHLGCAWLPWLPWAMLGAGVERTGPLVAASVVQAALAWALWPEFGRVAPGAAGIVPTG